MKGRDEGLKTRIDLLLVSRGVFDSRAKARAAVEAGLVTANGVLVAKPSEMIADDADLAATPAHPFVGRGALKLDHAISLWRVTVQDRVVVDVGASTGGFTEVCLLRGAAKVYAVDVGRGQLHPKLAADARVVSLEGLDARLLTSPGGGPSCPSRWATCSATTARNAPYASTIRPSNRARPASSSSIRAMSARTCARVAGSSSSRSRAARSSTQDARVAVMTPARATPPSMSPTPTRRPGSVTGV